MPRDELHGRTLQFSAAYPTRPASSIQRTDLQTGSPRPPTASCLPSPAHFRTYLFLLRPLIACRRRKTDTRPHYRVILPSHSPAFTERRPFIHLRCLSLPLPYSAPLTDSVARSCILWGR